MVQESWWNSSQGVTGLRGCTNDGPLSDVLLVSLRRYESRWLRSLGTKGRTNAGITGRQPTMMPVASSASLIPKWAKESWRSRRAEILRPESKRNQIPRQVFSANDGKTGDGAHDASNTRTAPSEVSQMGKDSNDGKTNNRPVAKTAAIPSFLLSGICKVEMQKNGMSSIQKSDTILISAAEMMTAGTSTQCPAVWGSHSLRLGVQMKTVTQKYAT